MAKKFIFRPGAQVTGVKPKTVYHELEKIRKVEPVTPKAVVRIAEPEKAPLHPAFDWDNEQAGSKWREHQARHLIKAVQIIKDDQEPTAVYVHIKQQSEKPAERSGYYEAANVVVKRPDLYAIAMQELHMHLNGAQKAIRQLEQVAKGTTDSDRLTRISLAVRAFENASAAVAAIQ